MGTEARKKKLYECGKKTVDRITARRTFEPFAKPQIGCRFHIFRRKGEYLEGVLGFPKPNFRRQTSYPLELDNGETVEILGNKLLHRIIKQNELSGQRVRIEYVGREFTLAGHWRKIYRVFKVKW
jgi:hypothetical protein